MLDLDQVVKERHSTRMFLPKPVPRELLDEAVALAQLAPSNSNIQPWHVVFVSGERGLGSCVEVSVAGYPEIVRAQLSIPEELTILCAVAVRYSDPDFPANKLHIARDPVQKNVVFLDTATIAHPPSTKEETILQGDLSRFRNHPF